MPNLIYSVCCDFDFLYIIRTEESKKRGCWIILSRLLAPSRLSNPQGKGFSRSFRDNAKVGISGLHVHVDGSNHNRQSLKNLLGIMYSKEDILFKALQVNEARAERWCKKVREPMLRKARQLSSDETKDLTRLEEIWYEGNVDSHSHYNSTRYAAIYAQ